MVLDPATMNGLRLDEFFSDSNPMSPFKFEDFTSPPPQQQPFLAQIGGGGDDFRRVPSSSASSPNAVGSSSTVTSNSVGGGGPGGGEADSPPEDPEIYSDIVLSYISSMLMEEDVDEKVNLLFEEKIRDAEKPFYDILRENYSPAPSASASASSSSSEVSNSTTGNGGESSATNGGQASNSSPTVSAAAANLGEQPAAARVPDLFGQFRKGMEEARKFLPNNDKLVIDLEASSSAAAGYQETREEAREREAVRRFSEVVKVENNPIPISRGRKNPNSHDLAVAEGRSMKQSAVSTLAEETVRSDMFDSVLLCQKGKKCAGGVDALREAMQSEVSRSWQNSGGKGGGAKARGKKQSKKEVVDLRTLLIHCAQAVAADDWRTSNELLKQIRQYSSPFGDGSQRLAHCFADGLEARLAGTGSQIYHSLIAKRTTATDILKAYQLYLAACPFKRISHFFSNQTILDVAANKPRVHIIDFGIYFGFQWPCLIQRLASRPEGPPRLRITGIDVPQPGFRPTERIEETGKRLADYARSFGVPFEYNAIASKWERIRVEHLKIDKDEVLVVNCLYRFRNLVDETVVVDSPRNMVLNTIRKANPDVFIHGIVNGSYSAPFFVTRFREALFHFSSLFDMLETNVPREDAQRLLIERDLFGREALNVISCEGSERVERPETYKQWQVRNLRAGFMQLPLKPEIMKRARDKVKGAYHKDFVIDEDNRWLLQGWKGRIIYAISTWKPAAYL